MSSLDHNPAADEDDRESSDQIRRALPAWLLSMVTHVVLLLALALWSFATPEKPTGTGLVVSSLLTEELEGEVILDNIELDPIEETVDDLTPSEVTDLPAVEFSAPSELGAALDIEVSVIGLA